MESSITERNLCAPTALSSQLAALHSDGAIPQVPTGTDYATGVSYDSAHGWQDFGYDGPSISNPTGADAAPLATQPSFDWFLNVNNNGAGDVANTVGASIDSIIKGAEAFYNRTPLAGGVSAAYHGRDAVVRDDLGSSTNRVHPGVCVLTCDKGLVRAQQLEGMAADRGLGDQQDEVADGNASFSSFAKAQVTTIAHCRL